MTAPETEKKHDGDECIAYHAWIGKCTCEMTREELLRSLRDAGRTIEDWRRLHFEDSHDR